MSNDIKIIISPQDIKEAALEFRGIPLTDSEAQDIAGLLEQRYYALYGEWLNDEFNRIENQAVSNVLDRLFNSKRLHPIQLDEERNGG